MKESAPGGFGTQLKSLREAAGFTQEELATIAGISVHAVSALERGQRRRPHPETVRSLSAALDLPSPARDALLQLARSSPERATLESGAPSTPVSGVLPHVLTSLVGREDDVRTLRGWLADPSVRLITLVGPGGVGKTRLALEIARETAHAQRLQVVFVALASIRDPSFVAPAIAEAFGVTDVTLAELARRVRVACADRPTLVLLDNVEHVLDAVPLVAHLLSEVAPLRVLATSRAPLRIGGEREYAVGPLALDARLSGPDHDTLAPAVRLFIDRVHDFDAGFHLTDSNTPVITAICERLDALPLAIELVVPWLKALPPIELLRRLQRNALAPTMSRRDLPERQRTMNATVEWSYQLLTPDEQRTFRRLGALPSRFPIEAAAAVCSGDGSDTLNTAAGLIERSLLLRAEGTSANTTLYVMLETVRAYALAELTASGERDVAMAGLARYCVATAATVEDKLRGPAQGEWLDRVRDDLETFRSGLIWLMEHDRLSDACAIAWQLLFFWLIRGHTAEGLGWYDRLLAQASLTPTDRAMTLSGAAVMRYAQGDLDGARRTAELALTFANDSTAAALAENILGHVGIAAGDMSAARTHFTTAVERFAPLGVPWVTGNALAGLAQVSLAAGDIETTSRLLTDARAHMAGIGPWFSEIVLYVQAVLSVRRGKPLEAIAVIRESLFHIQALHDRFALVYSLVPLAAAAEMIGDDAWAARVLAARDVVTERTGAIPVDDSVRDLHERVERDARARLGQRRWAREYHAGREASVESLLNDIDERLRRPIAVT